MRRVEDRRENSREENGRCKCGALLFGFVLRLFNGATAAVVAMALGVLAGSSAPKKLKAGDGF